MTLWPAEGPVPDNEPGRIQKDDPESEISKLRAQLAGARKAMNDSIALLSDTDLPAEERAGNAMMHLATALNRAALTTEKQDT